nr:polysaccharide lyase family 8 super-sandwich domain-containing protein [Rheinheimera lutimaris]
MSQSQKQVVEDALGKVLQEYRVGRLKSGNWWHWEIGIPSQINQILLRAGPWLDEALSAELLKASHYYLPKPGFQNFGASSNTKAFLNTGANRVDTVLIVLQRALLEQDEEAVTLAMNKLWSVIDYVDSGDGFYVDGSYIQHSDIAYIGSYGLVLFEGLNEVLALVKGTKWQPEIGIFHRVMDLYESALLPFSFEGRLLDIVAGRAVSRGWEQTDRRGSKVLRLLYDFHKVAPNELKERIEVSTNSFKLKSNQFKALMFPSMDRFVYRAPTYISAIAMHSSRTGNFECLNGANLKGWYTGDGMMYLQIDNNDYVDVWPLLDATSPPGTTTDRQVLEPCAGQSNHYNSPLKSQTWVGGAVLGRYAAIGMDFQSLNGKTFAKKSWFYLPDRIVALGSGIQGAKNTNIFQRFADKAEQLSWESIKGDEVLWLNNAHSNTSLGVLLPYTQQAKFALEHVKGDWQDINKHSKRHMNNTQISAWRARFDLSHAENDSTDYAYVLLPNISKKEMNEFSENLDIEVLKKDRLFHAIWYKKDNVFLANSYSIELNEIIPGKLSVKGSSSILVHFNEKVIDVSAADPEWGEKPIELFFSGKVKLVKSNERVQINNNQVLINTTGLKGLSVQFGLEIM